LTIADERLNEVSHLTIEETATLPRLLQGDWDIVRPTVQDCKKPQPAGARRLVISPPQIFSQSISLPQDRIDAFDADVGFTSAPALHSQC
jgi:hypothetical protein